MRVDIVMQKLSQMCLLVEVYICVYVHIYAQGANAILGFPVSGQSRGNMLHHGLNYITNWNEENTQFDLHMQVSCGECKWFE